jgi:Ran GTPase-activating protein (RanGAP) involved in mRNA processing and transport
LIVEHLSLTALDLSNDDSSQNKNRLGNAGLEAIAEGLMDAPHSVLSMLNYAQNNLSYTQSPDTFPMLRALLLTKAEQLICLNLSDNDLGADFLSTMGHDALCSLRELQLANTRLTNKSLGDLADYCEHHRLALVNLDLSSNAFTYDGFLKLFNALKSNLVSGLRRINLSRNDFSQRTAEEEGPQGYTIMEAFIAGNRSLEEMNLNECQLGPDGASVLGRALRRNQKLTKLCLSGNKLTDRGLQSLLEGLLDNLVSTSQMQGLLAVAPLAELDVSKNEL